MSAAVQDAEAFGRQTLCNGQLSDYLNRTFVCWGGDIRHPDAYRLSIRYALSESRSHFFLYMTLNHAYLRLQLQSA